MSPTPQEMEATMVANLKEKTGKTLDQWLAIAGKSGHGKHGALVQHLKDDHGLTHGYANLVAHRLFASAASDAAPDDLVAQQYAGKKAALRPIYDALVAAVQALGSDVEFAPKKAYVSLRRSKQFGLIQPSTATRVDLGLCLGDMKPAGRVEASGSFNAMVTHRVKIGSVDEIDAELRSLLKQAYDRG